LRAPVIAPIEIRDPLHGAIPVDDREMAVVNHPFVQRLRGIRQLGFSHYPFPGATHSRFAHSLGAMHLAGRAFDAIFRDRPFSSPAREAAFRHCLRLAALCHDLGHPPFSHAAEFAMPALRPLGVRAYRPEAVAARLDRQATHEDYTIAILTESRLAPTISAGFPFGPAHVAALVSPEVAVPDDFFIEQGVDLQPLLAQLISSELDVDRMDYLPRDSLFTGAVYGKVDSDWLISNLTRVVEPDGRCALALDARALHAFDDFIIARFHMFLMVYFHQKSIAYEEMLKRYIQSADNTYTLPADLDAYRLTDDAELWAHLRASASPWARRVVDDEPYKVALDTHGEPDHEALHQKVEALQRAGIDAIPKAAVGVVLKPRKPGKPTFYVVDPRPGAAHPRMRVEDATRMFSTPDHRVTLSRIYVPPEDVGRAREVLRGRWTQPSLLSAPEVG